jgi:hypothetical protein
MKLILIAMFFTQIGSLSLAFNKDYDTIKTKYEESKQAAHLDDFDVFGSATNMDCAGSYGGLVESFEVPKKFFKGYINAHPAVPANGPLFPAIPASPGTPNYVLIGSNVEILDIKMAPQIADFTELEVNKKDLLNTYLNPWFPGDSKSTLLRKNNQFIFGKSINYSDGETTEAYFYCWRNH